MTDERSTAPARRQIELNELRRADAGARERPSFEIPDKVKPYYHADGNVYRSASINDRVEFVDRGNRMHGYRPVSQFTIRSMVEIAQSRGWQEISMTGDKAFQSRAYVEAADRGISVAGYQPTDKDKELLANRAARREAKENPVVQAFLAATEKKTMTAAARKFPQLKEAFAARAVFEKQATEIPGGDKAQSQFKSLMTDRIALALHRGEPLPQFQIKQSQDKTHSADKSESAR